MSNQFVVQLPNRPGELSHLAKALCARGVNIIQIQQSTAGEFTSAQIFTDCCDDDTRDVLRGMGYPFVAHTNLTVEIEDTPCAFSEVNDRLVEAGVGLRGCCVIGRANGQATWAFAVDDEQRAREVLGLAPVTAAAKTAGS
jgi:hypothetical protein